MPFPPYFLNRRWITPTQNCRLWKKGSGHSQPNTCRDSSTSVPTAASSVSRSCSRANAAVRTADVYVVTGNLTDAEFDRLKKYLINPVERREASPELPETLDTNYTIPTTVETLTGFISLSEDELKQFIADYGLAMDLGDIQFCQKYFRDTEHRDPTITEVRMIDTYWSDHCRHTTFLTQISDVDIPTDYIRKPMTHTAPSGRNWAEAKSP